MTKDYFSGHSSVYAQFRPTYPQALYDFIFKHLKHKDTAWDCATGNGQVAQYLAKHFKTVHATDISQQQLDNAFLAENISYSISKAEQTSFNENQFDLITVGQALHWFNTGEFYKEVKRTSKPGALVAIWGYALLTVDQNIDPVFMDFYNNIVGPYWDNARRLVEEEYRTIPFPFDEIPSPKFEIKTDWNLEQLAGYLTSWSATQKYIKTKNENPVPAFVDVIKKFWKEGEIKTVRFPVFLKLASVK
jgi:ubiquinone/menaquinone biosynthesis C-methylase UbiE